MSIHLEVYKRCLTLNKMPSHPQRIWHANYWLLSRLNCTYSKPQSIFNLQVIALLPYAIKNSSKWFIQHSRNTTTISCFNNHIVSIYHGVNAFHYISNPSRADEIIKLHFRNHLLKLLTFPALADDLHLDCGCNWMPMLNDWMCDIYQQYNERLESC